MKKLIDSLHLIIRRNDSLAVMIVSACILFLGMLIIQNGRNAFDIFGFDMLPLGKRLFLATSTLFAIKGSLTYQALLIAALGSILGGVNISLAYTYFRLRGQVIVKSGLFSGFGIIFAFLGIGCAACGTAFVSLLFSFLGLSGVLYVLPFHGQEIGYFGIILVAVSTYVLSQKVMAPNVC